MLRFESTLAYRHLRSGGGQTLLTVSAVAIGVVAIVFITSLIFGLRDRISDLLTDILPHITITPPEQQPTPLSAGRGATAPPPAGARQPSATGAPAPGKPPLIISRIEQQSAQRKEIENWPEAVKVIRGIPHVTAVAPAVTGQVFISRGERQIGAQVFGADPESLNAVTAITKYVFAGHYFGLGSDEIVISYKLSQDLGVTLGDRVRLTSPQRLSTSVQVVGLYDTGQEQSFGSRAYLTLRTAQSLYATGTAVEAILVRTDDLFVADRVADRIAALLPYKVESWSRQAPQVVAGLAAQRAVAYLISALALAASAFAIASVLIVSVVQKSRQIGILKSMGARSAQILWVFTLEGLGIALIGSTLGAALGAAIVWGFSFIKQPVTRMGGTPEALFPTMLTWQYLAAAMLAATLSTVLAAILPARRAARLDPVQVMR
jgi:lipoprotein-releasing system permease protein